MLEAVFGFVIPEDPDVALKVVFALAALLLLTLALIIGLAQERSARKQQEEDKKQIQFYQFTMLSILRRIEGKLDNLGRGRKPTRHNGDALSPTPPPMDSVDTGISKDLFDFD